MESDVNQAKATPVVIEMPSIQTRDDARFTRREVYFLEVYPGALLHSSI